MAWSLEVTVPSEGLTATPLRWQGTLMLSVKRFIYINQKLVMKGFNYEPFRWHERKYQTLGLILLT